MNALRSLVTELQGEQEKINNTTKELIEEHNRKQKHIDVSIFVCGLCPDILIMILLFIVTLRNVWSVKYAISFRISGLPFSRYRRHRHHFDYFHYPPRLLPLTSPLLSLDLTPFSPF